MTVAVLISCVASALGLLFCCVRRSIRLYIQSRFKANVVVGVADRRVFYLSSELSGGYLSRSFSYHWLPPSSYLFVKVWVMFLVGLPLFLFWEGSRIPLNVLRSLVSVDFRPAVLGGGLLTRRIGICAPFFPAVPIFLTGNWQDPPMWSPASAHRRVFRPLFVIKLVSDYSLLRLLWKSKNLPPPLQNI